MELKGLVRRAVKVTSVDRDFNVLTVQDETHKTSLLLRLDKLLSPRDFLEGQLLEIWIKEDKDILFAADLTIKEYVLLKETLNVRDVFIQRVLAQR